MRGHERATAFTQDSLRFNREQCVRLEQQLRIALSGRVERWKAELWSLKLAHQKATNDELQAALHAMTERVLALEADKATLEETCEQLKSAQLLAALPTSEQQKCVSRR